MPRVRPRGALERSALADLFKNTLARIPSALGQLVYLASLRDPNSGAYRHHGLSLTFGREESAKALQESHERVFAEWQNLALPEKIADVNLYLRDLDEEIAVVLQNWRASRTYQAWLPTAVSPADRELYAGDWRLVLEAFRLSGGAGSGRGSSLRP